MPIKQTYTPAKTAQFFKNVSYETLAASWLQADGWEVFMPLTDHGSKTDLLISDGKAFYRIQVKSVQTNDESTVVEAQWPRDKIDYVLYFSRAGNWGYITPAFQGRVKLAQKGHVRFHQHPKNFNSAFAKI
ncbi:group I intron-associated PD-(D/E)XK endonuclease [Plesiomonas shigelloides]|nr:group I intron-associated PD-(D/E)XK endonuclease [Plesiomonas shigelloides]MCX2534566.1 group I intron-associated PD-(D/E)XK endonuclease [Plesiomonas shigelloides]